MGFFCVVWYSGELLVKKAKSTFTKFIAIKIKVIKHRKIKINHFLIKLITGFGDFVPAQGGMDIPEVSIGLCSLYLLFGIALLAMSFNLVQEEVINNVKSVAKRLGIIKDDEIEE